MDPVWLSDFQEALVTLIGPWLQWAAALFIAGGIGLAVILGLIGGLLGSDQKSL